MWGHRGWRSWQATAGGGRAAGQLLTSWTQHPNVPSPTGAEAFCWDRDVSMAPAHLQICVCAMSPMAGVLSLQLLTPEEPPLEAPGQEPGPLSPNMTPCPPHQSPSPLASAMLTHMSCSILPRKVPLSPQPRGRGGEVGRRPHTRPGAKNPSERQKDC